MLKRPPPYFWTSKLRVKFSHGAASYHLSNPLHWTPCETSSVNSPGITWVLFTTETPAPISLTCRNELLLLKRNFLSWFTGRLIGLVNVLGRNTVWCLNQKAEPNHSDVSRHAVILHLGDLASNWRRHKHVLVVHELCGLLLWCHQRKLLSMWKNVLTPKWNVLCQSQGCSAQNSKSEVCLCEATHLPKSNSYVTDLSN